MVQGRNAVSLTQAEAAPERGARASGGRLMYSLRMSSPPRKSKAHSARVLGREAFAAITAVEGLELSPESKRRLATLRSSGLSTDEQRAEVLRAYSGLSRRK